MKLTATCGCTLEWVRDYRGFGVHGGWSSTKCDKALVLKQGEEGPEPDFETGCVVSTGLHCWFPILLALLEHLDQCEDWTVWTNVEPFRLKEVRCEVE